ncbi:MAG: hypothetical protein ABSA03_22970 [Streptosporangiaceae bacterium]
MAYKVIFRDEAQTVFGGLDPAVRKRIGKLLDRLARTRVLARPRNW